MSTAEKRSHHRESEPASLPVIFGPISASLQTASETSFVDADDL